jgi:hypothetical protein
MDLIDEDADQRTIGRRQDARASHNEHSDTNAATTATTTLTIAQSTCMTSPSVAG